MPSAAHPRKPQHKQRMKENFLFFSKFLKHGITIASVWPSSNTLAKATIKQVDWEKARVIVELGAGTGAITHHVIRNLQPHTRFLAIERDIDFVRILRERFAGHDNVEIVQGDVRNLDEIFKSRGILHVDAFVSGLPTPSLPPAIRRRMLVSVRKYLAPHGVYSNITEIPFLYWNYYRSVFHDVSFDFVARNMPPGGVYHCRAMR